MLSAVEQQRLHVSRATGADKKSQFGQFLTPERTAVFMANLFPQAGEGVCRLLDAGAGIGSLSAAFLSRWRSGGFKFERTEVDAFEIDAALHPYLAQTLEAFQRSDSLSIHVRDDDFIHASVEVLSGGLFSPAGKRYTHAILNPPYKKIQSRTAHRLALRQVGIETVNLYSAFVALALAQMEEGGQVVAIVPRSFCNGPYYRPFRDFVLERAALRHMHLFASRNKAFKDDRVLQENIIIRLEKGGRQGPVTISTSTDDTFDDLSVHEHPFDRIVFPSDPECFIHVPTSPDESVFDSSESLRYSLAELGLSVSTGPVVDFRLKEHLRAMPEDGTVPLLYPGHIKSTETAWPSSALKKPNAIAENDATRKWLYPVGFYCVVRRFSAKEERRRIVAGVVDPKDFSGYSRLGFENHLNVFHEGKNGIPESLARGLAVFLNTTAVDEHFRRFNGHTQVNATDLKLMKYPSREALMRLGQWALRHSEPTQDMLDEQLEKLTA